jgi:hypothetical protein
LIASSTAWPESAFFILKKRALLAQNGSFFRSAEIVPSKASCSGLQGCWKEFEAVWKWRRELLDQGWSNSMSKEQSQLTAPHRVRCHRSKVG